MILLGKTFFFWMIFPVSFKIICLNCIMSQKLKIIVVGPKGSGKSTLSNFLLGQSDGIANYPYQPTVGCRILENDFPGQGNQMVSVELWDASGDNRYEACWKAIMVDTDAVVLVYNPDAPAQDKQLTDWFDFFVKKNGLRDEQCLIFANRPNPTSDRIRPPPLFTRIASMVSTAANGAESKNMFENFVKEVSNLRQNRK